VKIVNNRTPFTCNFQKDVVVDMPIAHKDGSFYIDEDGLKKLIDEGQIVLKYCDIQGNTDEKNNPNGSLLNIAGIINKNGNVLGLMPHPERANIPHSTLHSPHSTLHSPHSTLHSPHSTLHSPHSKEGSGVFRSIKNWLESHS
jgi:phosphoribosylformylglycinamidine (FGAM) synthase-like amidotransferase family enzyme